MLTYAKQLAQTRALVATSWGQGNYFSLSEGRIMYSVHGAAQIVCNPEVKRKLDSLIWRMAHRGIAITKSDLEFMWSEPRYAADAAYLGFYGAERAAEERGSKACLRSVWEHRPAWVRPVSTRYGNVSLHYLLGLFGLTTCFNDDPETTLKMTLEALDHCARWVVQNEKFLCSPTKSQLSR